MMWRRLSIIVCALTAAIAWAAPASIECPIGATLHKDQGIGGTIELLCFMDGPDGPVMHGPFEVLRPDGSVLYQGSFDHGKANGTFQSRSRQGTVESSATYTQGRRAVDIDSRANVAPDGVMP
jgi:hypothetical protein